MASNSGKPQLVMKVAIPSEAQLYPGTCRDLTAPTYVCNRKYGEEKVQTTKRLYERAAKAVVGMKIPRWRHRAGSIPALGTNPIFSVMQSVR